MNGKWNYILLRSKTALRTYGGGTFIAAGRFLNPSTIASMSNTDKLKLIAAWKSHPNGFLFQPQIRSKFCAYFGQQIDNAQDWENLLISNTNWFDDIFKNNLNP